MPRFSFLPPGRVNLGPRVRFPFGITAGLVGGTLPGTLPGTLVVGGLVVGGLVVGGLVVGGLVVGGLVVGGLVVGGRVVPLVVGGRGVAGLVVPGRVVGGRVVPGLVLGGRVEPGLVLGGRVLPGRLLGALTPGRLVANARRPVSRLPPLSVPDGRTAGRRAALRSLVPRRRRDVLALGACARVAGGSIPSTRFKSLASTALVATLRPGRLAAVSALEISWSPV